MNFLGHSFLCEANRHLIAGNLAGDSYKGSLDKLNHLPKYIRDGVKLHRFIDEFTDQSLILREAAHIFQDHGVARVGYIACDILLDHHLAKNWTHYSNLSYDSFISVIYAETEKNLEHLEPGFRFLFDRMKTYGWLYGYPNEKGIEQVLNQFSRRISFPNDLPKCMAVYISHKNVMDNIFKTFLREIQSRSADFIIAHELNIL